MRLTFAAASLALSTIFAVGLTSDSATAAPSALPDRALDIELKQADVKNVFAFLAEASGRKIVLDACVRGSVDLRLKNAPLPLVYDALAMKLRLVYDEDKDPAGKITVRCAAVAADAAPGGSVASAVDPKIASKPGSRVNVTERETSLPDALAHLAVTAKLAGVDYRASTRPKVNITLENVRLATAMAALADGAGVTIALERDRIVVTD